MKAISLLISILFSAVVNAQVPDIAWQETFGGTGTDICKAVVQTSDGGYLIGGRSDSNNSFEKTSNSIGGVDYWIIKMSSDREIEWDRTIGGSENDILSKIVVCPDGGYLLAGHSNSDSSDFKTEDSYGLYDYWLVKVDAFGDVEWDKTIGGDFDDSVMDLCVLDDGSFVILGISSSSASGMKSEDSFGALDYWVVKVDSLGNILWQKTLGGVNDDYANSINPTADSGFILSGSSESDISGNKLSALTGLSDYWVIKLTPDGEYEWEQSIGGTGYELGGETVQANDGNYIVAGSSTSPMEGIKTEPSSYISAWVIKFSAVGDVIWENTIDGEFMDYMRDMIYTTDGSILLACESDSDIGIDKTENSEEQDFWIVKLNELGEVVWDNTINGAPFSYDDSPAALIEIAEDSILVVGSSFSNFGLDKHDTRRSFELKDYWIVNLAICPTLDKTVNIFPEVDPYIIYANAEDLLYQWYEYDYYDGLILLDGRTDQYLDDTPPYFDNGTYTVKITNEGCETFSELQQVYSNVNLNETQSLTTSIYPNPAQNSIQLTAQTIIQTVTIYGVDGVLIETIAINHKSADLSVAHLNPGIYLLNIQTDAGVESHKLVVE